MTNFLKNILLFITILILLGGGAFAYIQFNNYSPASIITSTALQNSTNQAAGPGLPVRLSIPSINVDAQIIYVGLTADGAVATPDGPYQVAWYKLGPRPGDQGSAVLTGHYGPWKTGAKSVFDNLHTLKTGDKVYITDDDGKQLTFVVRESRVYNPDETVAEVFNKTDGKHLNLITCSGDWLKDQQTYNQRLVVFTDELVE